MKRTKNSLLWIKKVHIGQFCALIGPDFPSCLHEKVQILLFGTKTRSTLTKKDLNEAICAVKRSMLINFAREKVRIFLIFAYKCPHLALGS